MDLFEYTLQEQIKKDAPLAERMRPRTLDEFAGQSHILAKGRLLRRAIHADQLSSLIFYGPPGTGKTTLARIIANTTEAQFLSINAVLAGVKNIRESIEAAKRHRQDFQKKTILFVDEVHRFNKAQQDALLPHVENGIITLIGATTENPYFEVNKALVSRSRIFQLKSLEQQDLQVVLDQALSDPVRGFGTKNVKIDPEAREHLTKVSNGDARAMLNALELAVTTSQAGENAVIRIDLATAEDSIQQRAVLYDKDGDSHYDTISAFIKSMRGSDPDAALYWMARMVYSGEDPRFIFRRMIIFAGEDVGMADPNALQVVTSAAQAYDYVGMPEGRFHLAQACLYLSTAPKSNSSFSFFDALTAVREEMEAEVPNHLKDGKRDKEGFGHGEGYLYPHAYRDHWVAQQYLPSSLQGRLFYQPTNQGYESTIRDDVARRRESQLAAMLEQSKGATENNDLMWQDRTLGNTGELLTLVRDRIFSLLEIKRDTLLLNLNAGTGLLLGEALRQAPEGTIYAQVYSDEEAGILNHQYANSDLFSKPIIEKTGFEKDKLKLTPFVEEGIRFDAIISRSLLSRYENKTEILRPLSSILTEDGKVIFTENIPSMGQRLSDFLDANKIAPDLWQRLLQAEEAIYQNPDNPQVNWNDETLLKEFKDAGFTVRSHQTVPYKTDTLITSRKLNQWFAQNRDGSSSYAQHLEKLLNPQEIDLIKRELQKNLVGQVVQWKTTWMFLVGLRPPVAV